MAFYMRLCFLKLFVIDRNLASPANSEARPDVRPMCHIDQ
jgi:hypothetical protein